MPLGGRGEYPVSGEMKYREGVDEDLQTGLPPTPRGASAAAHGPGTTSADNVRVEMAPTTGVVDLLGHYLAISEALEACVAATSSLGFLKTG